jgi:hypothetical protein
MTIIPDDLNCIAIKRFNLPVTIVDTCPKCKEERKTRFDGDDYVSYPAIGNPTPVFLRCEPCGSYWSRNIVITFAVEVAEAEAETETAVETP